MIVKFFKHSQGKGEGPINYLLKKEGRDVAPEVLRGNPEETKHLINSLSFKHKYTSGVLAFTQSEAITPEVLEYSMNLFEQSSFKGLEREQYDILWVKHEDKGNLELHFVVPRVELISGKSYNPAPPGMVKELYKEMVKSLTIEYGLTNPYEIAKKKEIIVHDFELKRGKKGEESRVIIHNWVKEQIEKGVFKTRKHIVKGLKKGGFEVPREGKDYITVLDPKTNIRLRLKGEFYKDDFNAKRYAKEDKHLYPPIIDRDAELKRSKERYQKLLKRREEYNKKRYPYRQLERIKSLSQIIELEEPMTIKRDKNDRDRTIIDKLSKAIRERIQRARLRIEKTRRAIDEALRRSYQSFQIFRAAIPEYSKTYDNFERLVRERKRQKRLERGKGRSR